MAPISPRVSIVVPVFDAEATLAGCLESVLGQSLPREEFEVLVVDNGSSDATRAVAERYPVRTLFEPIATSYAARNRGAEAARGDVLAFLDADCRAKPDWLEEGLRALAASGAAIAAGEVRTEATASAPLAETYDRLKFLRQARSTSRKRAAATANLFVRRAAFDAAGGFDPGLVSGGDEDLCHRAVALGHGIVSAPRAVVRHAPRRTLAAIARKSFRVGVGTGQRARRGRFLREAFARSPEAPRAACLRLFLLDWALKPVTALGVARGLLRGFRSRFRATAIRFRLHGVTVDVRSEDAALLEPIASAFGGHLAPDASPDIEVLIGDREPERVSAAGRERGAGEERFGYRLRRFEGGVRWTNPLELPGLDIALALGPDRLKVGASHADPHGRLLGALRRIFLRTKPAVTRKNVLYFCVYFPLFWWLGRTRGMRLLHAAGAEACGLGLLVSGLGGSGKSTTSVAALSEPGSKLLSNNLVLHDAEAAYAVPEPVQLTPSSVALAGDGARRLRPSGGRDRQMRGSFLVRPADAVDAIRVDRVVVLSFGEEARTERMTPSEAVLRIRAGDDLSLETRHFRSFSAVMDLAFPDAPPLGTPDPLEALLSKAVSFRCVVKRDDSPIDLVRRAIDSEGRTPIGA